MARAGKALVWSCAVLALTLALAGAKVLARPTAGAASVTNEILPVADGGAPFAIADFDGDKRPDLARVQAGQSNSFQTQYWIQLQLTQAGRQVIGVIAPIGGLQVRASDVNGDHAIDLVLSTAWLNRPVAILLNDGHGRFTTETPTAYPGAFRRSARERLSQKRRLSDAPSATQPRPGVYEETELAQPAPEVGARCCQILAAFLPTFLLLQHGRAPPLRS
ncbi:MAG: VCBS repeat-containing protein [Candidatus Acidiferrales bacterium]